MIHDATAMYKAQIESLKTATQLIPGSQIHWNGTLQDVHQVVFWSTQEGVSILGVEIWNETAQDVRFVPWHAVDLVIPPDPDETDE